MPRQRRGKREPRSVVGHSAFCKRNGRGCETCVLMRNESPFSCEFRRRFRQSCDSNKLTAAAIPNATAPATSPSHVVVAFAARGKVGAGGARTLGGGESTPLGARRAVARRPEPGVRWNWATRFRCIRPELCSRWRRNSARGVLVTENFRSQKSNATLRSPRMKGLFHSAARLSTSLVPGLAGFSCGSVLVSLLTLAMSRKPATAPRFSVITERFGSIGSARVDCMLPHG